jgi:tRNA threonylcarbamoyladenosine biosynthesis protein TsaB
MALILNIETATDICSVALARDGKLLALREEKEHRSHALLLTSFISQCVEEARLKLENLDAIAVSKGPGSFTGLRIGVATAKGLCYSLDKPLIGINTLQSMAANYMLTYPATNEMLLCPMIDARRMEVYTAIMHTDLTFKKDTAAEILTPLSFKTILDRQKIAFFGDGMIKAKSLFQDATNAIFNNEILPSALGMVEIAEKSYVNGNFESTAYFEPYYLKDFFHPGQPVKSS